MHDWTIHETVGGQREGWGCSFMFMFLLITFCTYLPTYFTWRATVIIYIFLCTVVVYIEEYIYVYRVIPFSFCGCAQQLHVPNLRYYRSTMYSSGFACGGCVNIPYIYCIYNVDSHAHFISRSTTFSFFLVFLLYSFYSRSTRSTETREEWRVQEGCLLRGHRVHIC